MKKTLVIVLSVILVGFASYKGTIHYFPNYVYQKFYNKTIDTGQRSENQFSIIEAPDESSRMVVKPNPDFAYGSAFFNLAEGPLKISGALPDSTYWSVAMYYPNTVNFYVKNDLQFGSPDLDIILTNEKLEEIIQEQVISDRKKGFILIRLLITDRSPEKETKMINYLKTLKIEEVDHDS